MVKRVSPDPSEGIMCGNFSLFTLTKGSEKERQQPNTCLPELHPFKQHSLGVFLALQPSVLGLPVCCWFYFLKKRWCCWRNRFSSRPPLGICHLPSLSLAPCSEESFNFFFSLQLFFFVQLWKKLKMHKTGIEWEKRWKIHLIDASQGEILLISNRCVFFCRCYLREMPRSFNFLGFEWNSWLD